MYVFINVCMYDKKLQLPGALNIQETSCYKQKDNLENVNK